MIFKDIITMGGKSIRRFFLKRAVCPVWYKTEYQIEVYDET